MPSGNLGNSFHVNLDANEEIDTSKISEINDFSETYPKILRIPEQIAKNMKKSPIDSVWWAGYDSGKMKDICRAVRLKKMIWSGADGTDFGWKTVGNHEFLWILPSPASEMGLKAVI